MAVPQHPFDRLAARPLWLAPPLGGLAALGFEPLSLWPLTLLALAGLIELVARASGWRRAALIGWLFGVGHFTIGNNWIATAFTYQANMPQWLGWIAVVLLSFYLAVYPALATGAAWWIVRLFRRSPESQASSPGSPAIIMPEPNRDVGGAGRAALLLAFAGCWIVAEWLRSWVFTGYAWNPLAMAALGPFDRPGLALLATWLGTYGLSALVVLLAGCWLLAFRRKDWRSAALVLAPVALMLQPFAPAAPRQAGGLAFTLVQPDVRQESLNEPRLYESNFVKTARLTLPRRPGAPGERRLVLWPESGVPDYLREGYPRHLYYSTTFMADPRAARARIGKVIGPDSLLLTGVLDLEIRAGKAVAGRNAVTALDGTGRIVGSYAKAHLVPYGEYLPLRWLLEPLGATRLVPGAIDFWPGPGPRTLDLGPWSKAGVQICYEIIFSGQVVDPRNRPDFLFNPSNDGWFGSWGPPQHLAQARLRAIEEGLPVLRATTTGISAVIDSRGAVVRHIPRHVAGRLDGIVPAARAPTLFARLGNLLPLLWAVILIAVSVVAMRRARR